MSKKDSDSPGAYYWPLEKYVWRLNREQSHSNNRVNSFMKDHCVFTKLSWKITGIFTDFQASCRKVGIIGYQKISKIKKTFAKGYICKWNKSESFRCFLTFKARFRPFLTTCLKVFFWNWFLVKIFIVHMLLIFKIWFWHFLTDRNSLYS